MKIHKITSTYFVNSSEGEKEYDKLEDAEKRIKQLIKLELEGYVIRRDYLNNKLIDEIYIG